MNYRAAVDPEKSCLECSNFTPPETCALVAGHIDGAAVCDLFSPRGGETEGPGEAMQDQAALEGPEPAPAAR